ncbi:unnamed protein product, partial [Didymodactylos carnosus]
MHTMTTVPQNHLTPQGQYNTGVPLGPGQLTVNGGLQSTGAQSAAAAAASMPITPLLATIANVKDSRWLTLEVCREYQRGKCTRSEQECKFAHPPTHVEVNSGKVIACFDSLKGKCNRTNPPCKYLHPPQHLRDILLQNGRNNLILRSIAMNIAANQAIYPQQTHIQYPNGAIPIQSASLASYPHLAAQQGPNQSALLFNPQFSIPIQQLSQIQQLQSAMYSDQFSFQPVAQLQQKTTRTDRLEVYPTHDALKHGQCVYSSDTCPLAHPQAHCPLDSEGLVTVCVDFVKGKCARESCKYFHPPEHLVQQLKAVKANNGAVAQAAAHAAVGIQYSPSTIQLIPSPATPTQTFSTQTFSTQNFTPTYTTSFNGFPTSIATHNQQFLQQNAHDDNGQSSQNLVDNSSLNGGGNNDIKMYQTGPGGLVSPYNPYMNQHIQTIAYARAPSADIKGTETMVPNAPGSSNANGDASAAKPPGTQLLAAPQYISQQKRSAVADPKTGVPMAYPVTTFSYPSGTAGGIPLHFQQPYLTAVPMT